MPTPRTTAGRYFLRLEGVDCGFLSAFEGGATTADVIAQPTRGGVFFDKHLGPTRVEPIVIQAGLGLDKSFYAWLRAFLGGKAPRQSGSIVGVDASSKARWEREFKDALITEVGFPALDGADKGAAALTVTLLPEEVRTTRGPGASVAAGGKKKLWTHSNFRLELDGLDCKKVTKLDAFSVTQKLASEPIGERRLPARPGKLEFENLRVRLAEAGAQSWVDWADDFIVGGKNDDGAEKDGRLVFLAPDLSELGEVPLSGVGIFRLDREPAAAGATSVPLVRADLYCERIALASP